MTDGSLILMQRDDQEASASRDLIPRYAFTPDSQYLIANYGWETAPHPSLLWRPLSIPFVAHVDLPAGPGSRQDIREDTGPVQARLMQAPSQSPDGSRIVFSALAHIYEADLATRQPRRLTQLGRA
jgi:Tol biopolymer transport system component